MGSQLTVLRSPLMVPTVPNTPLNPPVDATSGASTQLPAFGKMDGGRLSSMVGLKVDTKNVVSSVVPGSPADVSGVKVGNKIPKYDAFEEMGPVIGASASVEVQMADFSKDVELVAADPTLIVKAEETLKAIEGLSRHLGQKGDWDGRVLCSFLRDNTRELLRICYATFKPAQRAMASSAASGEKGPDLLDKVQLLEERCAALTEHLQMQQEAIEDYQQRLNRYETPGGGQAAELSGSERIQYESAISALKGELKRSEEQMDAFRASSDRIMKAQEQQMEQLRSPAGGPEAERLREHTQKLETETEALRGAVKKLGEQLMEAKAKADQRAGGEGGLREELSKAERENARLREQLTSAEKMVEEYTKVPSGGKPGSEEKRLMLAKVSLMEQAMGQCIEKMKQRQTEMEEDKEEYRRVMQQRLEEAERAAKARLDGLEEEKAVLESKMDALQSAQVSAGEKAQLRELQRTNFALEERVRDAVDDANRAARDRDALRQELDRAVRAMQGEMAERLRASEDALAEARARIGELEEEERTREQEKEEHLDTVRATTQEAFAAMAKDIKGLQQDKTRLEEERAGWEEERAGLQESASQQEWRAHELAQQLAGAQTVIKRGLEEREKSKEKAAVLERQLVEAQREVAAKVRQLGLYKVQVARLEDDLGALRGQAAEGAGRQAALMLAQAERRALMDALLATLPNNSLHLPLPCGPHGLSAPSQGKRSGELGLVLAKEEGKIGEEDGAKVVVRAMNPSGPAARSGLLAVGDEVITIQGELAARLAPHEIEDKTTGEAGAPVALFTLASAAQQHRRLILILQ